MNKPIRVLHVLAALDSGGVANFIMNTYRVIDRERVQYDFALTSGKKSMMDDEAAELGGRLFYFDDSRGFLENYKRILHREGPFDVVHSHVFFYSGILLSAARGAKVPIRIAHAHNAYTGESRAIIRRLYEAAMQRLIRAHATHMLGCSEKACRYLFGNDCLRDLRVQVVIDGIDRNRFAFDQKMREAVRSEFNIQDKFVVGHVGHFTAAKNHEKILSVFWEVVRCREDAVLLLVGDGELEESIRNRAKELALAEKVVFAGACKDVERYYQTMDVFLFPSRYEGFGMAMIEAQANGLACIASDVVPKETDANGRTVFLPLDASDQIWGQAVLNASRRTSLQNTVGDEYSIDETIGCLERIYEEASGLRQ